MDWKGLLESPVMPSFVLIVTSAITFAMRNRDPEVERLRKELAARYSKWWDRELVVMLILTFITTGLMLGAFVGFRRLVAWGLPDAAYTMLPGFSAWFAPSLMLGFFFSFFAANALVRRWIGEDYEAYATYRGFKLDFVRARTAKVGLALALTPFILYSLWLCSQYTLVQEDRIVRGCMVGCEESTYLIQDIREVQVSYRTQDRDGHLQDGYEENFLVVFNDGRLWSNLQFPAGFPRLRNHEVMSFVALRAGVEMKTVEGIAEHLLEGRVAYARPAFY